MNGRININLPVIQAPFLAYFPSWLFACPSQLRTGCKLIFMQHDMNCMPLVPALVPSFLILPATSNKNVADVQTMKYGVGFTSTAWGRPREMPVLSGGKSYIGSSHLDKIPQCSTIYR